MVAGPLVAIVGETGSGKSELAMRIAMAFDGEIICADAWTIRRGMDIGTAKPSQKDRQTVVHHMIDLINPDEEYSVADYQRQANVVINSIHKRNKLPVIVGGSGLYIDSVLYNYSFLTTESKFPRGYLNNLSLEELQALARQEQINMEGIDVSNKRRVVRLIETGGQRSARQALDDKTLVLGLKINKLELEGRLRSRLDKMIKEGLEEEVRQLSQKYGWQTEALKGMGYREWQDFFIGSINSSELKERIIKDSMHLAKKQRTWFMRNKDIHWLSTPVNWHYVAELLTTIQISAV